MSPYPALRQVDVHTHALPMPLLEWLAREGRADLSGLAEGTVRLAPEVTGLAEATSLSCPPAAYDHETRLAQMDARGVEVHAVALPSRVLGFGSQDTGLVRDLVQYGNEELARFVGETPDRLVALGAVHAELESAADEARRCLVDLGMRGMALGTHGGGRGFAEVQNDQLWSVLAEYRAFTLLHPVSGTSGANEPALPWSGPVAAGVELALAAAGLLRSGVLERHDVPLCLAFGGGALLALRGLIQRGAERLEGEDDTVRPLDQLRRLYYDTATFDTQQLVALVDFVGPDHVLMGSDFPSPIADDDPIGVVEACQFGPVQEMITGVNAMNLLHLEH
ncbi:aminocarboxymuconate-semialdehyde decarboxylase [Raineyella antarctica]|uniref:Aminocarboxymuconate-semialdehyde decarboxylase n=1 Tax=Raineyella antarctica TaxID=1577474 RepID=A0A1G6GGP3_9ACTN|nr:amidohydrolase family protein [Raineyella antarctica]SDB81120.1 aminocarboxymuconate-semialdehyde decarboxylase [Raineyella antarctica]